MDNVINTGLIHDIIATTSIGKRGQKLTTQLDFTPNKPFHKKEEKRWWEDLWPGS